MPRKTPKRRRSVAFPEQEDAQESVTEETQMSGGPDKPIDITDNADNSASPADGQEGNADDAPLLTEKEQEIWESFREEYFEGRQCAYCASYTSQSLNAPIQFLNSCPFRYIVNLL